jgi:hypothetical protein
VIESTRAPRIILWSLFLLCVALTLGNIAKTPLTLSSDAVDEPSHISYALHLIAHARWWPDFTQFFLFDVPTGTELPARNYINHPPTFYWLMKLAHQLFPWWEPIHFRAVALVFYLVGMALYTRLGVALAMPVVPSAVYGTLPLLVYLYLQTGFYNNDALCFLGGGITTLYSFYWLRGDHPRRALLWMGVGVVLASVKLTALLLIGFYALACALQRPAALRALPKRYGFYALLAGLISVAPYAYMFLTLGSPAPNTPGQLAKLIECLHCHDQGLPASMDFFTWLTHFLARFADQLSVAETTFIPILLYALGLAVLLLPSRAALPRQHNPSLRAMAIASLIATLATVFIHAFFSWQRYRDYGWIFDSLLRYYLPLLGAYGAVIGQAIVHSTRTPKNA